TYNSGSSALSTREISRPWPRENWSRRRTRVDMSAGLMPVFSGWDASMIGPRPAVGKAGSGGLRLGRLALLADPWGVRRHDPLAGASRVDGRQGGMRSRRRRLLWAVPLFADLGLIIFLIYGPR